MSLHVVRAESVQILFHTDWQLLHFSLQSATQNNRANKHPLSARQITCLLSRRMNALCSRWSTTNEWILTSCLCRFFPPRQPQGDRWNAEVSAELHNGYANTSNTSISTSVSSRGAYRQTHNEAGGPWNSLGHRRVHSAPNIMEGMKSKLSSSGSARWRSSALPPWLASDAISPGLREHAIPEGRRFEVRSKEAWCW